MAGVCLECNFCHHKLWDEETYDANFCPKCGCSYYHISSDLPPSTSICELDKRITALTERIRKLEGK